MSSKQGVAPAAESELKSSDICKFCSSIFHLHSSVNANNYFWMNRSLSHWMGITTMLGLCTIKFHFSELGDIKSQQCDVPEFCTVPLCFLQPQRNVPRLPLPAFIPLVSSLAILLIQRECEWAHALFPPPRRPGEIFPQTGTQRRWEIVIGAERLVFTTAVIKPTLSHHSV